MFWSTILSALVTSRNDKDAPPIFWIGAGIFVLGIITAWFVDSFGTRLALPVKTVEPIMVGIAIFVVCGILVPCIMHRGKAATTIAVLLSTPFFVAGYHLLAWYETGSNLTLAFTLLWIAVLTWAWGYKEGIIPPNTPLWSKLAGLASFLILGFIFTPGSFGLLPADLKGRDIMWPLMVAVFLFIAHALALMKQLEATSSE